MASVAVLTISFGTREMRAQSDELENLVHIQSVATEPAGQFVRVKVELLNSGQQVITAYALAVSVTFAGGYERQGSITRDMVSSLVNESMGYPLPNEKTFGPGRIAVSTVDVPAAGASAASQVNLRVVSATATVTMAAFADKTACGSAQAVARLMATRSNQADEAKEVAADFAELQGHSDAADAVRHLLLKADARKAEVGLSEPDRLAAERHVSALHTYVMPATDHPEGIPGMAKAWQIRSELLREHSSLHRTDATDR